MPLDPHQARASQAPERLVRCLAGAGSGKTATLQARVRWLAERTAPTGILALTFSKAAAEELQTRCGPEIDARTVHSLGYRILREEHQARAVANDYATRRMIREGITATRTPGEFAKIVKAIRFAKATNTAVPQVLVPVLEYYERALLHAKVYDFDDLVLSAARALTAPDVRQRWANSYTDILVDELQDTSALQWDLIASLVGHGTRLFICGDLSQSIYGFRGATPSTVLHYLTCALGRFAEYRLPMNYRSRPAIVALANAVIADKPGAVTLEATRVGPESSIALTVAVDARAEADTALGLLNDLALPWQDCAVLYRLNAQSEAIESACLRAGIPYRIAGINFYNRAEVLDALAYLRLSQGWDADALERIYNRPSRYLGRAWRTELEQQGGWPALLAGTAVFSKRYMHERSDELLYQLRMLQGLAKGLAPVMILTKALDLTGYRAWLIGDEPAAEDESRAANLDALVAASAHWESVEAGLAAVDAARAAHERNAEPNALTLSTVHRAKGLEWRAVAVLGVVDGFLPLADADADEERRIFYVAATRARDHLLLLRPDSGSRRSAFWPAPTAADEPHKESAHARDAGSRER